MVKEQGAQPNTAHAVTILKQKPGPVRRSLANWKEPCQLMLINTVIGTLLYSLDDRASFAEHQVTAHCAGSCIWLLNILAQHGLKSRFTVLQIQLGALLPGLFIGLQLAGWLGVPNFLQQPDILSEIASRSLLFSVLVALIATAFVLQNYQSQQYRLRLEQHKRQLAELSASEHQARLLMLQAQIEPHFLFNTLATVISLIGSQPAQAQSMLMHLNKYLRTSLQRTRLPVLRLADEIELTEHLLTIAKIRLGERLKYEIRLAPELMDWPLPPLLLQPLIENALRHAVEPSLTPVFLEIYSQRTAQRLQLCVRDNGPGVQAQSPNPGAGLGLENIRQRLHQLYQDKASLKLYQNHPHGCLAVLELPVDLCPDAAEKESKPDADRTDR